MRTRGAGFVRASFVFFGCAAAAAWLVAAACALADRRALRRPLEHETSDEGDSVTVIVPARNEQRNIGDWLRAARKQRLRNVRIIIVDDESTDGTASQALRAGEGDPRVQIIAAGPRPAGWVGKPWAAYVGASLATSDWLLFSDADVRMAPHALPRALAAAKTLRADALSLTVTLECESFWERIVMPAIALVIFSAMPVWATHSSALPIALLAGPFMLVRAGPYWLTGGHAAARASIAEDRDIAEHFKAFGFRVRLADGSRLARLRMYHGLADMWRGWRKNAYEGVRRNPWGAACAVAASVAMFVLPLPTLAALFLLSLTRRLNRYERALAIASTTSAGAMILARASRDPAIGIKTTVASIVGAPLAGVFIAAVMAASAWRLISGRGQLWKGRTIA